MAKKERPKLLLQEQVLIRVNGIIKSSERLLIKWAFFMCDMAHPAGLLQKVISIILFLTAMLLHQLHIKLYAVHAVVLFLMGKDVENKLGIKTPKGDRLKMMSEIIDGMVMPGIQGGPLMHIIMAKAVAFGEALSD
jgi:glycine hydroxymethyltransferase